MVQKKNEQLSEKDNDLITKEILRLKRLCLKMTLICIPAMYLAPYLPRKIVRFNRNLENQLIFSKIFFSALLIYHLFVYFKKRKAIKRDLQKNEKICLISENFNVEIKNKFTCRLVLVAENGEEIRLPVKENATYTIKDATLIKVEYLENAKWVLGVYPMHK